jgi:hypothetical protein
LKCRKYSTATARSSTALKASWAGFFMLAKVEHRSITQE